MSDGRSTVAARSGPQIVLGVEDEDWEPLLGGDPEALATEAIHAAAGRLELAADIRSEISVTLANDEDVRALNAEWRGKDKPTNILSFPMLPLKPGDTPGPLLGDLILARETVAREAVSENKAPADHFRHLLVHGFLHLLGYDHESDEEAAIMEAIEIRVMADLGIADPYAEIGGEIPSDPTQPSKVMQ